jgi:predicted metal-binding membrane protein
MKCDHAFIGVIALLCAASAGVTIAWSLSMSAMDGMAMPGEWTMSMVWMPPGERWTGAAGTYLAMWIVMMIAMMLPSLLPSLLRYRHAVGSANAARIALLTAILASGYFAVWIAIGIVAYPVGIAVAAIEMRLPSVSQAVPFVVGVTVLGVGVLQFTPWKARRLACCRAWPARYRVLPADAGTVWGYGLKLGLDCVRCCGGLMVLLFAFGVMDLVAMVLVTVAITVERVAPAGERLARAIGGGVTTAGLVTVAQALGIG